VGCGVGIRRWVSSCWLPLRMLGNGREEVRRDRREGLKKRFDVWEGCNQSGAEPAPLHRATERSTNIARRKALSRVSESRPKYAVFFPRPRPTHLLFLPSPSSAEQAEKEAPVQIFHLQPYRLRAISSFASCPFSSTHPSTTVHYQYL
jgi:hypothetical protein